MYEMITLIIGVVSVVWIKRKGLTAEELQRYAVEQLEALRIWVVRFKIYRGASGHVWLKFSYQGWVQARWCTDAKDGYLVRVDGVIGTTHKTYVGIIKIEDYTKRKTP